MSRMLGLIDAGWQSVRSSAEHGRRFDALTSATRLLARPDLPASVAAEAHRLAGELHCEAERYSEARRHLRAAAALEPSCSKTFYLWGLALERDPNGCDRRAALRHRRASELEATNHLYRAAFGRAAVRCGRAKLGVRELLGAACAAPGDVRVLRVVVDGLVEAGKLNAARSVLTKGRFLRPNDRELVSLGERVRFEAARSEQRKTTRQRQDAEFATDGGRVVIPFVRVRAGGESKAGQGDVARRDVLSLPRPHFPRLKIGKAER